MTQFLENLSKRIVMVLFTLILGLLTALSLLNTCYIDITEHTHYTFLTLGGFLSLTITLVLLFLIYKFRNTIVLKRSIWHFVVFALLLGTCYVFVTKVPPAADQKICLSVAEQMHAGNFEAFEEGNYMQAYPQQVGIVLVYYMLGFLFGTSNIIALQVINVLAYAWFIYGSYQVSKQLFHKESLANSTAMLCICFLPLLFYTSFVYGTMLGLAASTYAFYKANCYMASRKRTDGVLCALLAGLSVLVKKNYLIVVIALVLILLLHSICKKHYRALLCICLIFASYLFFTIGAKAVTEQITDTPIGDGIPSVAWVTMGLQNSSRASGWYNRYSVNVYQDHDNDSALASLQAKSDLKKRLIYFVKHPQNAIAFFTQKTASEWSEPSFQCFYIVTPKEINVDSSPLIARLLAGRTNRLLYSYLNVLQSIIYLGTFFFVLYEWKRLQIWDLVPAIIFLGGFLFHLVWEAKGQYTLCYFVLLFPYCIKGISLFFSGIDSLFKSRKTSDTVSITTVLTPALPWLLLVSVYFVVCATITPLRHVTVNANATYTKYLSSLGGEIKRMNGLYRIKTANGQQSLTFYKASGQLITASLGTDQTDAQSVRIQESTEGFKIESVQYKQSLSLVTIQKIADPILEKRKSYYTTPTDYCFQLIENKDGSYRIKNEKGYVLTYDDIGTITFQVYDAANTNQSWILEQQT